MKTIGMVEGRRLRGEGRSRAAGRNNGNTEVHEFGSELWHPFNDQRW
jgi:hypothetical protein